MMARYARMVSSLLALSLQTQSVVDPELLEAVEYAEAAGEGYSAEEGDHVDGDAWG